MRHQRHTNHLSRNAPHARALLRNLAASVLQHQQITTTLANAKAVQPFVDRLITLGKTGDLTARRRAIALLGNVPMTQRLFRELGPLFAARAGGYTRIIRLGFRRGDGASLALLELTERIVITPPAAPTKKKRVEKKPATEPTAETAKPKPAPHKPTAAPRPEKSEPPPTAKPRKLLDGLRQWWGRRQADRGGSSRG